jgi:hypothetical protein
MILHKEKVRFTITGVVALVVLAGILAPLPNIETFKPQIEKESVIESIGASVLNPLKNAWQSLQGKAVTVVY